jgi:hypothetical protein
VKFQSDVCLYYLAGCIGYLMYIHCMNKCIDPVFVELIRIICMPIGMCWETVSCGEHDHAILAVFVFCHLNGDQIHKRKIIRLGGNFFVCLGRYPWYSFRIEYIINLCKSSQLNRPSKPQCMNFNSKLCLLELWYLKLPKGSVIM